MDASHVSGEAAVKRDRVYTLLALAVLGIAAIPVGAAVFVLGFVYGDSPCVMCWEQRTGMALIALLGLFVLRYGPRPKYVGLAVLVSAWGVFMAVRHTALHAARDVGQGFSAEILGAHTYTWALLIFWVASVAMGVLLLMLDRAEPEGEARRLRPLEATAAVVFLVVIAGNIVQAFASTGPPPFMGQSDPVRFSFDPRHWVWSLDEWSPAPVSLRGRWAIAKPSLGALAADPAAGPIAGLAPLVVKQRSRLAIPMRGTPTDLAYDAASDRFLVTSQLGVYLADGGLARLVRHTVVDPGYSVDLGRFAGAAFLDSRTVMAVGENKSYVILRESDRADAQRNFRFFLESFDQFDEVSRSRFGTVRARMMYTMSLAFDPATKSLFTIGVPNARARRLVVSRFDRRDLVLSEEFGPALSGTANGPVLAGGKRSLDELCFTGATVAGSRLYAISAAYATLVAIDLPTRAIVSAWAVPGLNRPVGLALKGSEFYIVSEDGTLTIAEKPD